MAKIGDTWIALRADRKKYKSDLKDAEKDTKSAAQSMGQSFKKVFATLGIGLAVREIVQLIKSFKSAASDAEEISSKFGSVFENVKESAKSTASLFSREFKLADTTAKEMLGTTGDLLVGFGFAEDQALSLSDKVNRLAVDVASFSNYSGGAKGASEALTKALLGETESAKSLGIVIRQNTDEFRDNVKELMQTKGITEQQAKAMVILDQAYQQSYKAVGDFNRTQNSLANQERILSEQFKELKETLGKELVPAFNSGISSALSFIRVFTEDTMDKAIRRLSELGAKAETINKIMETKTKLDTIKRLAELTEIATGEATKFGNVFGRSSKNIKELTDMLAIAGREDLEGKEGMLQNRIDMLIGYYERLAEAKEKGENTEALEDLISKREYEAEALQEMINAQREINLLKGEEQEIDNSNDPNKNGKNEIKETKEILEARKAAVEELYKYSEGLFNKRVGLLEKEKEEYIKLTGDKVAAEEWFNQEYEKLLNERNEVRKKIWDKEDMGFGGAWFESTIQGYNNYIEFVKKSDDEAAKERMWKFEEYIQQMTEEYDKYLEESKRGDQEQARDRLNAISQLGAEIQRAFDPKGDGLLSILNQALQTAIQIARTIESINAGGDSTTGVLGILGSVVGFAGLFLKQGGQVSNYGNGRVNFNPHVKAAKGLDRYKVPAGFNKDDYLIGVTSGETVTVTPNNYNVNNNFNDRNITRKLDAVNNSIQSLTMALVKDRVSGRSGRDGSQDLLKSLTKVITNSQNDFEKYNEHIVK